jgi:hypothetical protein
MKETELIVMQKKIESITRLLDYALQELSNVKTLAFGNHEVLKSMPGYKKSIKQLTDRLKDENEKIEGN